MSNNNSAPHQTDHYNQMQRRSEAEVRKASEAGPMNQPGWLQTYIAPEAIGKHNSTNSNDPFCKFQCVRSSYGFP